MSKENFKRHELKYLIPFAVYEKLARKITPQVNYDRFGNEGKYRTNTLYFDSADHKIYYETRNKLKFRQKLRLRTYNNAGLTDVAFFELKQKYKRFVNKRRTTLRLDEAYQFIESASQSSQEKLESVSNMQFLREVDHFRSLYQLEPKIIIHYDRQAFQGVGEESDLRITFDYNLLCRSGDLRLEAKYEGTHFVDPELVILEVKVTNSVPLWLNRMLAEYECTRGSVSKFCTGIDTAISNLEAVAAARKQ